ncbi:MAG: hypothetical protein WCA89_13500, partial [Terracidiphilus sp.]
MKKLLLLMIVLFAFVATGVAQYHPAPVYHPPPAYHPPAHTNTYHPPAHTNTYHAPARNAQPRQNHTTTHNNTPRNNTPRNNNKANHVNNKANHSDRNAQRNQRNAERDKRNADRHAEKTRANAHRNENKARHNRNNQRRHDYRSARSAYRNGRFNDRYFHSHYGREHAVVFSTPGLWVGRPFYSPFWWGGMEWGFGPGIFWPDAWGMGLGVYIDYVPGIGYVLVNPAFPDTTLPLSVDIDAQPVDDSNQVPDQPY